MLLPTLGTFGQPNSIVVCDNCSLHGSAFVELVRSVGAEVYYLPCVRPRRAARAAPRRTALRPGGLALTPHARKQRVHAPVQPHRALLRPDQEVAQGPRALRFAAARRAAAAAPLLPPPRRRAAAPPCYRAALSASPPRVAPAAPRALR